MPKIIIVIMTINNDDFVNNLLFIKSLYKKTAKMAVNKLWWCLFEKVRTHFAENPNE